MPGSSGQINPKIQLSFPSGRDAAGCGSSSLDTAGVDNSFTGRLASSSRETGAQGVGLGGSGHPSVPLLPSLSPQPRQEQEILGDLLLSLALPMKLQPSLTPQELRKEFVDLFSSPRLIWPSRCCVLVLFVISSPSSEWSEKGWGCHSQGLWGALALCPLGSAGATSPSHTELL